MRSLDGKVALVIGASRGMGKQMALELARCGADVAVAARTSDSSQSTLPGTIVDTANEIRALGRQAEPVKVDLAHGAEIDAMVARTLEVFEQVDVLVHSVQYHGPGSYEYFLDTAIEELETQMWVNAMSAVRACKLVVPHMAARGGGVIVLVTSGAAKFELPGMPGWQATGLGYPISKAALGRFVPALAKEVRSLGISVVGLSPGFVLSEHVQAGIVGDNFRGWDVDMGVPPTVPAKAAAYLCTCDDPMVYTGEDLESSELVAQHDLA